MGQTNKRDTKKAAIVIRTAEICGVSERYVRMVIGNERQNEVVMSTYMTLLETGDEQDNLLKVCIKELVPFGDSKPKKEAV